MTIENPLVEANNSLKRLLINECLKNQLFQYRNNKRIYFVVSNNKERIELCKKRNDFSFMEIEKLYNPTLLSLYKVYLKLAEKLEMTDNEKFVSIIKRLESNILSVLSSMKSMKLFSIVPYISIYFVKSFDETKIECYRIEHLDISKIVCNRFNLVERFYFIFSEIRDRKKIRLKENSKKLKAISNFYIKNVV